MFSMQKYNELKRRLYNRLWRISEKIILNDNE